MQFLIILLLFFFSLGANEKPSVSVTCRDCGMFSAWMDVLMALEQYDEDKYSGLRIDFGTNGFYYDKTKGPNWWEYYCEPIDLGETQNAEVSFGNPLFAPGAIEFYITREEAHRLYSKYITVKPEILYEVQKFYEEHFQDKFVISVHYRGTDKITEVPLVPYLEFIDEIAKQLKNYPKAVIFVATDEMNFLKVLKNFFKNKVVHQQAERSNSDAPLHIGNSTPYQQGKEAMIDALLLAKGEILIRSSSNLSRWSTYFNPHMKVIELPIMLPP